MPRTSKGARLVWREESRKADGSLRNAAGWFIRDGQTFIGACGGTGDRERAEKRLAAFIGEKYRPARQRGRDPDGILIADVVNVYLSDIVPTHAKPKETAARLIRVLTFFGERRLGEINGKLCRDFAVAQPSMPAARRALEDFRAAVNHYHKEGYATAAPAVVLPAKPEARDRWLTRDEAARLLWAAWRMRQGWKGTTTKRWTGRHLARFMLVALYTGSRSAAICGAALRPTEGRGHVDLEAGVFFRRAHGAKRTKKRQPPVRLPARLVAHMRRWRDTLVDGQPIANDFVVEWNGRPVQSVKKSFRTARAAAGLGDDVTPHIFRHTAATWLMQSGTDPWAAAGFLGMTVQTLVDNYGHHHPDFQADAAEAITTKAATRRAPKNVVRLGDALPGTEQTSPHHVHPTETAEINRNIGRTANR